MKPDALIVGEVWHYAGDFLEGDEWDSVMNYPFCHAVRDLVARGTLRPSELLSDLGFLRGNLHRDVEGYLWNFIDTHDTARFLYSAGNDPRKQRLAAAFQLLLPGMPMIYYGDEVGMNGSSDSDCRRRRHEPGDPVRIHRQPLHRDPEHLGRQQAGAEGDGDGPPT